MNAVLLPIRAFTLSVKVTNSLSQTNTSQTTALIEAVPQMLRKSSHLEQKFVEKLLSVMTKTAYIRIIQHLHHLHHPLNQLHLVHHWIRHHRHQQWRAAPFQNVHHAHLHLGHTSERWMNSEALACHRAQRRRKREQRVIWGPRGLLVAS